MTRLLFSGGQRARQSQFEGGGWVCNGDSQRFVQPCIQSRQRVMRPSHYSNHMVAATCPQAALGISMCSVHPRSSKGLKKPLILGKHGHLGLHQAQREVTCFKTNSKKGLGLSQPRQQEGAHGWEMTHRKDSCMSLPSVSPGGPHTH